MKRVVQRTNIGKQTGMFIAELGNWNLRQTAENRYKVAAINPVNGKANYAFGVKDCGIDLKAAMDCYKLRDERIDLYKAIEAYFHHQDKLAEPESKEEIADPYGDLAMSRRQKVTPAQNWKRGLLQMRRIEFEHAAAQKAGIWESGVRMLWAGVFKTKISDEDAAKAVAWITARCGSVDLSMLLAVERNYYEGKYAPHSSATLEAQLDMLAGSGDYENEEEHGGFRPDRTVEQISKSGGGGTGEGSKSRSILRNGRQGGTSGIGSANAESGTDSSEEPSAGEDPFSAFH